MAIPLVQVRHKDTGKKTFLPLSSLANFPDYVRTPSQKARDQVPDGSAFPGAVTEDETKEFAPPPRSGSGSSLEAWRAYADVLGLEVPEDASRDDIVALVDFLESQG